jgi:hypothetical protein
MTTTLAELIQTNDAHTQRFSYPFQVPLFEDPRTMTKAILISMLNARQLSTTGRNINNPEDMDDRQPEKWLHIGNIYFAEACRIEPDRESRVVCFGRCNEWIKSTITDQSQLIEVAKGVRFPDNESPLFLALCTQIWRCINDTARGRTRGFKNKWCEFYCCTKFCVYFSAVYWIWRNSIAPYTRSSFVGLYC